jgi:predicted DCC family thiol-disulfide oxidoreductase YuxK
VSTLVWDGECDFCRRAVGWVARRDRAGAIEAVRSQELGMGRLPSVRVVTPDGETLEGGRACLQVLRELGHPRAAAVLDRRPLRWGVEAG